MYLERAVDQDDIICSINVGNTCSSVSFLDARRGDLLRDLKDRVHRVNSWPGSMEKSFEIPSRLCYLDQKPVRYGNNAMPPGRSDPKWTIVEFFKRHVNSICSNDISYIDRGDLDPFPEGVTLHQIYKDWVGFLFKVGSESFRAAHSVQDDLWDKRLCVFVASNGWNEPEQANFRKIIYEAGCVEDPHHVRFARESEADLHYGLFLGLEKITQPLDLSFFVCNVGSSTGDIGFYKVTSVDPLCYGEIKPAESFPVGQIVDEDITVPPDCEGSKDDVLEDEEHIDPIDNVVHHIQALCNGAPENPTYIIFEGVYSGNSRARERIAKKLQPEGISVLTLFKETETHDDTTTASYYPGLPTVDGALYSCVHNFIVARRSPYSYGSSVSTPYDKGSREHNRRKQYGLRYISGKYHVPYAWETILPLGSLIDDGELRKKELTIHFSEQPSDMYPLQLVLYATREENPEWVFEGHGKRLMPNVREICKIIANLDIGDINVEERHLANQQKAYQFNFTVGIQFGSVTSKAVISWKRKDGTLPEQSATFVPPHGTAADWHTNNHQGDRDRESLQNIKTENKGSNHPGPIEPMDVEGGSGSTSMDNKQHQPFKLRQNDDGRASVPSGRYTISNPGNPRGLGYASWDKSTEKVQCRRNTNSSKTMWIIDFDDESQTFTIRPRVGTYEKWCQEGKPEVGFSGQPELSSPVLAWQTRNSGGGKRWYAIRPPEAKGFHIRSVIGGLAWSINTNTEDIDDYIPVLLQRFDQDDLAQIWWLQCIE